MKRFVSLTLCFALVAFAGSALARSGASSTIDRDLSDLEFAIPDENTVLTSSTSDAALRFKEAAGPDTFALYGYTNDPVNGKFNDINGVIPQWQGWMGVDMTDALPFWQVSTFNAANLNNHGAGNLAAWSGQTAAQQPGWVAAPGYGNGWNDILIFETPALSNTVAGQTVGLDFFFNHDSEPGYDFLNVEYDSAGTWVNIYSVDGDSKDTTGVFAAPGVQFSAVGGSVVYGGGDYGGPNNDQIRLRIRFQSDGAWSNQDGLWPTSGGAVQVDDITVSWNDGVGPQTAFEDFESGAFTVATGAWHPQKSVFAGDFAQILPRLNDIDPCQEDITPLLMFIDQNQVVGNASSAALIPGYPTQTGGATSINPSNSYGPGGYVVNFNGGLSQGQVRLWNMAWSPEITWDLPTTADDGVDFAGARMRFDVWRDLQFIDGMFYFWQVRSSVDGVAWKDWADFNTVYYGGGVTTWLNSDNDITPLLEPGLQKLQVSVGVYDLAGIFPGTIGDDASPSPAFDNIAVIKYRISGPTISQRVFYRVQDGFPVSGSIDVSTQAARDGLDIPFSMANDVATGSTNPVNDAGDSTFADIQAVIPGSALTDMRMFWVLDKNPLFEDAIRTVPARAKDVNVVAGATQWTGEVLHDTTTTSNGNVIKDRYFFDLPDTNFMYPGDVLRIYYQATDDGGRVTTLPSSTTGFLTGNGYSSVFTVRGLPSISDVAGTQPPKLVLNDFGHRGSENDFLSALGQLGFVEGVDYDTYTTTAPSSGLSNGIGSAGVHGANANQLAGYDTIVYLIGNLSTFILSDGSNNGGNDKANDLAVLTSWHGLAGPRNMVHFGDNVVSGLIADSAAGATYVATILNTNLTDNDVRDEIGNQTAPLVKPLDPAFATEFVAYGGCLSINQFDSITPAAGSIAGHGFWDPGTASVYAGPAASVIYDRLEPPTTGDRKVDMVFPYSLGFVYDPRAKAAGSTTSATELLREIFDYFAVSSGVPGGETAAPSAKLISMDVYPNPFNPQTTVKFANLPAKASGSVKVFNLRGELVATLHSGEFSKSSFVWNGTDNNGSSVASGVYMIEGQADGFRQVVKVALVK